MLGSKRLGVVLSGLALLALTAGAALAADSGFSASAIYREAAPSVVMVYARLEGASSTGTGTLVSRQGHILTNDHVVSGAEGAPSNEIAVFFKPERVTGDLKRDLQNGQRAEVVARSEELDLVLLKVRGDPPHGLTPVAFGDSEGVPVGTSVAAIGHPGGGGLWTLTTGTISNARRRGHLDVFQTDAAINPGNSGGPLLDGQARLIGVNTFVVRVSDGGVPLEGLNYSLRGNSVRQWLGRHGLAVAVREDAPEGTRRSAALPPAPAAPAKPAPAPAPSPERTPAPKPAPEPRAFAGPQGEAMYGVPDRSFSHDGLQRELYSRARSHAEDAFRELDGM